jgi:hypothetical protein
MKNQMKIKKYGYNNIYKIINSIKNKNKIKLKWIKKEYKIILMKK